MKFGTEEIAFNPKDFYAKLYPNVRSYILTNSGNEAEAKDIFQEAILAVWLKIKQGKLNISEEDLYGYIYQVAKHKWLDQLRSKGKRVTKLYADFQLFEISEDDGYNEIDTKRLLQSLAVLGNKCKLLLRMFYYQKFSQKEIGDKLGYKTSVVKTQKYRCMQKLREIYLSNHEEE